MASKNSGLAKKAKVPNPELPLKKPAVKKVLTSKYGECFAIEVRAVPKK